MLLVALNAKYSHTSLSVRSIYSYVKSKGINNIDYIEATINDNYFSILKRILEKMPNTVGFSCYIWNIELVKKLVCDIKSINSEIIVFLGGPEVTYNDNIFDEIKDIDFIIKGEGEIPVFKLLNNEKNIKGVCYKGDRGEIASCLPLEDIPFVYTLKELKNLKNRTVYYETSRGCPFNCAFCISSLAEGVRTLPLERVYKEIDTFIDSKVKIVKLVDRTFNFDKDRAYRIIDYIIKNTVNTCFHFEIGADLLDERLINLINSADKNQIQFEAGIQSTNYETLKAVNRKTDISKLKENLVALSNSKSRIHVDLIAGLPKEDYETFKESFNEAYGLNPDILQLGFLKLLHGSKLRVEKEKHEYAFRSSPPYEVLSNKYISFFELMKLKEVEKALDIYFNSRIFKNSLRFIFENNDTEPFSFYLKLGNELKEDKLSLKDKFILLYNVYKKNFENIDQFSEYLKLDYVIKQRGQLLPIFDNYKNKESLRLFKEFLSNDELVYKYFKDYLNVGINERIKNIDYEIFNFGNCYKVFGFDRKNDFYIDLSAEMIYHNTVDLLNGGTIGYGS